jgi:hypothetical protein
MTDEFGSYLLISTLDSFFYDTTPSLWIYPLIAFTYSLGGRRSETGKILRKVILDASRNSVLSSWRRLPIVLIHNFLTIIFVLVVILALAFTNGLLIAALGIVLEVIGVIDSVTGTVKVSLCTAILVFIGHLGHRSTVSQYLENPL